jgi:hypothetical protein
VQELLESLELHARQLEQMEDQYRSRSARPAHDLGLAGFGLVPDFEACCRVLRAALAPAAGPRAVHAVEAALITLSTSLRSIDIARLIDMPDVLHDNSLPPGRYILPRATELMGHWRRNVQDGQCLQAMFEVQDDSGSDVLCLMCLDAGWRAMPETTPLRGLAPFADLIEALGGQFHLWIARPGDGTGCRREHRDSVRCAADGYVTRIEERLRHLSSNRWHSRRDLVQPWLTVLNDALVQKTPATLAFAILPRAHE